MSAFLDYAGRAQFYEVELRNLTVPRVLRDITVRIRPTRILEVPCGTGHYLELYQQTDAVVALVDAEPAMHTRAQARAATLGLRVDQGMVPTRLELLRTDPWYDLVVVPRSAVNLLAADCEVTSVFSQLRSLTAAGGVCFVEANAHECHPDEMNWTHDWTRLWYGSTHLTRLRRTRHLDEDRIEIGFRYTAEAANFPYETAVTLRLFAPATVIGAATQVGFTVRTIEPNMETGQVSYTFERPRETGQ